MPTTPNRNYPYPLSTDAATVPAHMGAFLAPIDADMQTVYDEVSQLLGHNHDDRYYTEAEIDALLNARDWFQGTIISGGDLNTLGTKGFRYVYAASGAANRPPGATGGIHWNVPINSSGTSFAQGWLDREGWTASRFQLSDGSWAAWMRGVSFDDLAAYATLEDLENASVNIQVGGAEPASGWWLDTAGNFTPPAPDVTPPTPGTLAVTIVNSMSATLTVTGASDNRPGITYGFSSDNGLNWTDYQAGNAYTFTGLTPSTGYAFRHRVRDSSGNVSMGATKPTTMPEYSSPFRAQMTSLAPTHYWPLDDPVGTLRADVRDLGSATTYRVLDIIGLLGAPTIGDGNTAGTNVGTPDGFSISRLSTNLLNPFTLLFLVRIQPDTPYGLLVTGFLGFNLHSSGNLIVVNEKLTGATGTAVKTIPKASWPGRHLVGITYDGTTARSYWDGEVIQTHAGGTNSTPTTGSNLSFGVASAGNKVASDFSSLAYFQGTVLTTAQIASLYNSLEEL